MELSNMFITYKDLSNELNVSYDTVCRRLAPRIIKAYNIDINRLPKQSGLLPRKAVEEFFNQEVTNEAIKKSSKG